VYKSALTIEGSVQVSADDCAEINAGNSEEVMENRIGEVNADQINVCTFVQRTVHDAVLMIEFSAGASVL
jgi:hypothetical protein